MGVVKRAKRVREKRSHPVRPLLLDTHVLVWWLAGDRRLPASLRRRIADGEQKVYISAATAWEAATKVRLGKFPEATVVVERLPDLLEEQGFAALPISMEAARLAGMISSAHRDPFDRILAAQAMLEDVELVSKDPAFALLGVEATW